METVEVKQETVATVQQPAVNGMPDLSQIKDLAGGSGAVTIVLALILGLGGGAGWKFYSQHSEQKHEVELKKIEVEKSAKEEIEALKKQVAELELAKKLLEKDLESATSKKKKG